jgi:copper chaperone CopZ
VTLIGLSLWLSGCVNQARDASNAQNVTTGSATSASSSPESLSSGSIAPDFSYQLIDGRSLSAAQLHGHPYILWLMATWCSSCEGGATAIAQHISELRAHGIRIVQLEVADNLGAQGPSMQTFRAGVGPAGKSSNWYWGQATAAQMPVLDPNSYLKWQGRGSEWIASGDLERHREICRHNKTKPEILGNVLMKQILRSIGTKGLLVTGIVIAALGVLGTGFSATFASGANHLVSNAQISTRGGEIAVNEKSARVVELSSNRFTCESCAVRVIPKVKALNGVSKVTFSPFVGSSQHGSARNGLIGALTVAFNPAVVGPTAIALAAKRALEADPYNHNPVRLVH